MITKKLGSGELLFRAASNMGLHPSWIKQGSLFAVPTENGERYFNYSVSTLNSQLSSSLVGNKEAARLVLARRGLPTIAHLTTASHADADAFLAQHKKIIVKPLRGSNSHDVHIVTTAAQLAAFHLPEYILEEYAPGKELRYLFLEDEIISVHESQYGESVAEDRPLVRISYPRADWDRELVALSLEVAQVFGLRFGAVDYIVGPDGQTRILEVNSSPGMKWFHAPSRGPVVDVASLFLEAMLEDMQSRPLIGAGTLAAPTAKAYS